MEQVFEGRAQKLWSKLAARDPSTLPTLSDNQDWCGTNNTNTEHWTIRLLNYVYEMHKYSVVF